MAQPDAVLIDNLECELIAAASRADAAVMMQEEDLPRRIQWLSRVSVRLVVCKAEARFLSDGALAHEAAAQAPAVQSQDKDMATDSSSDGSESSAQGEDLPCASEPEFLGSFRGLEPPRDSTSGLHSEPSSPQFSPRPSRWAIA